ncbi:MAG TPA: hypothetical protein VKF41_08180 [Bryobacteraceae bacterium]|nr:hypothetical protein [Bryobacteraceae bacterium]
MNYQWLAMRITEEQDRRQREAEVLARLPRAIDELQAELKGCIDEYRKAFGAESAEITGYLSRIRVTVREKREGKWEPIAKIEIHIDPMLPGFQVDCEGGPLCIEVGVLPGDKIFYRDTKQDQYVTTDDLTRRILDRGLFPRLPGD